MELSAENTATKTKETNEIIIVDKEKKFNILLNDTNLWNKLYSYRLQLREEQTQICI